MKYKVIIIMASLFSTFYGCGQDSKSVNKNIFPQDSFYIIEATINNKLNIGSINLAYKNYKMKSDYSWFLWIAVALDTNNLFDNGLPKNIESNIAYDLEDELLNEIKKITTAHYIGHIFNDTFLDIYIYLDEPEKVHRYLQTQIDKPDLIRGFGYEIKQDHEWKEVGWLLKLKDS